MRGWGGAIGRLSIALALIVQIVAPVRASVAMATVATDPLVDIVICGQDLQVLDRRTGHDPAAARRAIACALCHLVTGDGFAPPPSPPLLPTAVESRPVAAWIARVAPVAVARLLDHIRGRAPPVVS